MAEESEQKIEKNPINIEMLNRAMEAFNAATVKLQSSYDLLQEEARKLREEIEDKNRKLSDISNLLQSILNNTRSSILVVNEGAVIIKNRAGDRLIESVGENVINDMIKMFPAEGVYDYSDNGRYFRVSVGTLITNNINGAVYVLDDITNIKKLEKEKQHNEKMQLMGEMAANIAHDIRNPLGSMELFISLLDREIGNNPEHKKLTTNVLKSIRTINGIISNTLLFAKEIQINKNSYFLADIVDEVVLYLQHVLKDKRVAIINKLDEEHSVKCDRDMFRQVIMNILHNAVDAVPSETGKIIVESYTNNDTMHLLIEDNGCGIPEDLRSNLFIPFQTTKAKGTGLGLSIAYKIIKAHGGEIDVKSDGKSYTVFDIILPYVK